MSERRVFLAVTLLIVAFGVLLRLKGINQPILDHPGWRQGDTAAIARNFALLQYNPLFPQTDYNGPPPNYVELELQIVPFLAATLYKIAGVHEIFGRLISLAFGAGTIAVIAFFARWLFASRRAGLAAAATYAILPGAWYYARTFQPESAMVFFATAALFACAVWIVDRGAGWRCFALPAALLAVAFLAKPVAVLTVVPIAACAVAALGGRGALRKPQLWALALVAFVPLAAYDAYVSAHAEWHWASGITKLHVLPGLRDAFTSPAGFAAKAVAFAHAGKMLATTMLGPVGMLLAVSGFCVPLRSRSNALLWGWLAGALAYAYVVVTVERVDYYLSLFLPLGALVIGRLVAWGDERVAAVRQAHHDKAARIAVLGAFAAVYAVMLWTGYRQIRPYWEWNRANFARAKILDARLAPGALIVMAHYDPSILYLINRKGWEEDPKLWTPFDEQSAIRKGARYFVSIEHARLKSSNLELYCWLDRFPRVDMGERWPWPVYDTDPAKIAPGAETRWRAFRTREMEGAYHDWKQHWRTAPEPC